MLFPDLFSCLPHLDSYVDQPEPGVEGCPESRYIGGGHLEDEGIVSRETHMDRRPLTGIARLLADGEVEGAGVIGNEPERRRMGQAVTSRVYRFRCVPSKMIRRPKSSSSTDTASIRSLIAS